MTQEDSRDQVWLASILGLAAGPTLAGLHETGMFSAGPAATLWPLVLIVIAAMMGVLVGRWVATRRSRLLGFIVAAPNALVLLVYGFFLIFFGMGGSR